MKNARFRSLVDAWGDATAAHWRLMLTVLGGLAWILHEGRWMRGGRVITPIRATA
jgi:hypothetical protein